MQFLLIITDPQRLFLKSNKSVEETAAKVYTDDIRITKQNKEARYGIQRS